MNVDLKKPWRVLVFLFAVLMLPNAAGFAAEPLVSSLAVEGNNHVVAEHILGVVATRVGEPLSREQLQSDVEAIYNLGFFSFVDINLQNIAGGVGVTYIVKENPVVEQITFSGNNIYKDEELMKVVFTMPGTVFNRVFFRNDLDRIQEKYHKDGYVMVKIADVVVEGGLIDVKIVEPKVGNIIIQGNKKTKTKVIAREIKLKKGDPFNATILRHSLNKLQNKGFFEDVNVGFEPGDDPEHETDIIVTVVEQKTGSIGISMGHGTSSGWSGGITYTDTNWRGLGHIAETGFELGDNEQYWISYTEPYMDADTYGWKVGIYKRKWEDKYYYYDNVKRLEYNDDVQGIYFGAGKKFRRDDRFSWYLTFDWRDADFTNVQPVLPEYKDYEKNLLKGRVFSLTGTLTRNNSDPYLSYPKGDIIDLNVEHALEALGGDYGYTKYWLQARYYTPFKGLGDLIDTQFGSEDNPAIFAARMRIGFSSGLMPTSSLYSLGGSNTIRGYDSGTFEGTEMFLGNAELRIPVDKAFGVVVFYDTGNAWTDEENRPYGSSAESGSFSLSDLHSSWGFGVRVKTPLGNVRVDYATGDYESQTHFGFGDMF
ncbi:outer membrane protein assembly factor [Aminivibrio sp.]|uniref:BamA/OMP85 family outer membrane protein n=1 Tax=Aminivibrio sp. TaxID=1872489 RepID=UPI0025BFFB8D|nr:BamA/TamA family outer membrane protein [Aminivibrio sp.]MDK2959766.1 outer membrane protein insertion porin family [Synergistaceae bacterium]